MLLSLASPFNVSWIGYVLTNVWILYYAWAHIQFSDCLCWFIIYCAIPFSFWFLSREDSPITEVEPYIPFNINPAGMQPILTTTYLLAFPSILARLLYEIYPCYVMMARFIFFMRLISTFLVVLKMQFLILKNNDAISNIRLCTQPPKFNILGACKGDTEPWKFYWSRALGLLLNICGFCILVQYIWHCKFLYLMSLGF